MKKKLLSMSFSIMGFGLIFAGCGADNHSVSSESASVTSASSSTEIPYPTDIDEKEAENHYQESLDNLKQAAEEGGQHIADTMKEIDEAESEYDSISNAVSINLIQLGMTYDEVKIILGGEGKLVLSSGDYTTYSWSLPDNDSSALVTADFKQDALVFLVQTGIDAYNIGVSEEEFSKIYEGMSFDEVQNIMGPGTASYLSQGDSYSYTVYIWNSEEDAQNYSVAFTDGIVSLTEIIDE